jgi:hypothetical protein
LHSPTPDLMAAARAPAVAAAASRQPAVPRRSEAGGSGMGRTPEPFRSMVPDPLILREIMGHKRGPLGYFSWVGFTNPWVEPLHAHLYKILQMRCCPNKTSFSWSYRDLSKRSLENNVISRRGKRKNTHT